MACFNKTLKAAAVALICFHASFSEAAALTLQLDGDSSRLSSPSVIAVRSGKSPSNYCGIYSVYAVAKMMGRDCIFAQLVDRKYVSSLQGSSAHDLMEALDSVQIESDFVSFMPLASLRASTSPCILRLRIPGEATSSGHWIVFCGFDGDLVRVYDAPANVTLMSEPELLALWDGTAIRIRDGSGPYIQPLCSIETIAWVLFCILLMGVLHRSNAGMFSIPVAAVVTCLLFHCIMPKGFVGNSPSINTALPVETDISFPEVGKEELNEHLESQSCNLVDARTREAFAYGNIPSSVNVPVIESYLAMRDASRELDSGLPTIVYCQSEGCAWAEVVARRLTLHGVNRLIIYRGGYNDWVED